MATILLVDDDHSVISILKAVLEPGGYNISTAGSGMAALRMLRESVFDLMITDVKMPGMDGFKLMEKAKEMQPHLAVVVISASSSVDDAVKAMKHGAFDYIAKPFKFDELLLTVQRALAYCDLLTENKVLRRSVMGTEAVGYGFIVGNSQPMLEIFRLIEKIARTTSTVLILGESGTGKELVAKAIHNCSSRSSAPFVKVNCAAMPEQLLESELFGYVKGAFTGAAENKSGLFEEAQGGTIFLDEIGSIPLMMQVKLLRTLQEKEIRRVGSTKDHKIDVRVVAATNEDLQKKIARGEFREDLFFRLSVIPITVPPLRARREDIPCLIKHFLSVFEQESGRRVSIADDAIKTLTEYEWPGNIRQLENLIRRVAILSENGTISSGDLPQEVLGFQKTEPIDILSDNSNDSDEFIPLKEYLKNVETAYIRNVLKNCNDDKEKAARILDVSLATLYRKL